MQVFALKALKMFTEEEMERILCGEQDAWAVRVFLYSQSLVQTGSFHCSNCVYLLQLKNLEDHMEFEHGYDISSQAIIIVSSMPIRLCIP